MLHEADVLSVSVSSMDHLTDEPSAEWFARLCVRLSLEKKRWPEFVTHRVASVRVMRCPALHATTKHTHGNRQ